LVATLNLVVCRILNKLSIERLDEILNIFFKKQNEMSKVCVPGQAAVVSQLKAPRLRVMIICEGVE
jgi:hypothetical protein